MTDSRVTQGGVQALTSQNADIRVTQGGIQVLIKEGTPSRITQAGIQALIQFDTTPRITQAGVQALVTQVDCATQWVQFWKISRLDGQVFAFTSHDVNLTFKGVTHKACNSLTASASELGTVVGSPGNQELVGILSDDDITDTDIYAGLFDGATIEAWLAPWQANAGDTPKRLIAGRLSDAKHGDLGFQMEIVTPAAEIQQKSLLQVFTPSCRWILGDSKCTVDLDALAEVGSVKSLPVHEAHNNSTRRQFTDTSQLQASGYFDQGVLTWTSGNNSGSVSQIKTYDGSEFVLWEPLYYPIEIGDEFSVKPGCDKTLATCRDTYNNVVNFGGFPHIPGDDAINETAPIR